MGTNRLAELLRDAAEPVAAPQLAERAWVRAGQVRRRRIGIASGIGTALAVAGVAAAVTLPGTDVTTPNVTASQDRSTATKPPEVPVDPVEKLDRMPASPERREVRPLPPDDFRPANAVRLSTRTMDRAVALYQPVNPDDDGLRPVYALSDSGTWFELDIVRLEHTRDEGGNRAVPLRSTALAPNGKYAAIAQPNHLVLIDLTAGQLSTIEVPGFNEHVLWQGTSAVIVGGDSAMYRVQRTTRQVTKLPSGPSMWDLIAQEGGSDSWLELPATGFAGRNSKEFKIRDWRLGNSGPESDHAGLAWLTPQYGIDEWYGRGWRNPENNHLVVRAGFGHTDRVFGLPVVAVVSVQQGWIERLLPLEGERGKGSAEALGWLDEQTVLLRVDPEGILAWDIITGDIRVVTSGPLPGVLALQL
jgi:hypothetical protein